MAADPVCEERPRHERPQYAQKMRVGQRLAVIDLGSNSFRLVVFSTHDGWWQRTDEIYEPVRIGEGLAATGRLGAEPIRRALASLDVFAHFCEASGLGREEVDAVATSAIRDAENADELLSAARRQTGLPIRVLSASEEAWYGHLAAVNSTTLTDGCVLDLGGGSLQLVSVCARHSLRSASWPLGAVRMSELFLPESGPAQPAHVQALREHVAATLQGSEWLSAQGRRIVGLGGTARNLAAAAQRAQRLPGGGVQGFRISRKTLAALGQRLAKLPAKERAKVPGIKPARADLILAGAVVIDTVLEVGGFEALEVTEAGLREGIFFEWLLDGGTAGASHAAGAARSSAPSRLEERSGASGQDHPVEPLIAEVRAEAVLNLARRYGMDSAHTRHVARLALSMFDSLAQMRLHEGDPAERELLWAACMLHDIGMSIDYDDHHKHSQYLIINAGLPGFDPTEVATIAQAVRYHRKGMPEPGALAPLFSKRDLSRLDRLAVLLRLAEDLERSRDQLVADVRLTAEDGAVRLRLLASGQTAVPQWAARRERELFKVAFGRDLQVVG